MNLVVEAEGFDFVMPMEVDRVHPVIVWSDARLTEGWNETLLKLVLSMDDQKVETRSLGERVASASKLAECSALSSFFVEESQPPPSS